VGGYENVPDEEASYRRFVENIEQIIAEEQQLYWRSSAGKGEAASSSAGDKRGKIQ